MGRGKVYRYHIDQDNQVSSLSCPFGTSSPKAERIKSCSLSHLVRAGLPAGRGKVASWLFGIFLSYVIITYKFDSIKIHRKILNKFSWYKKWHSKKFHNIFHWIIFLVITGLAFCVVFFGIDSSVDSEELNVLTRVFYIDPEHGDDSADGLFETSAWESF